MQTLAELVPCFEQLGDETAYVWRRGYRTLRMTYGELALLARRFASELGARGIHHGDRVMLWSPNCGEWVATFYGCALCGVVAIPMDAAATPEFAMRVARDVSARLIVCSRDIQQHATGFATLIIEDLSETLASRSPFAGATTVHRYDTLQITFTSGTTSEPRGVVITHGNVLANLEPLQREIAKYLRYERIFHPLRFLDLLPLSHVFGQFMAVFVPQTMGATVVFQLTLSPSDILRTIKSEGISVAITVPRVLQSLKRKIERNLESVGKLASFQRDFEESEHEHFLRRWWRFRRIHSEFGWKFWAFISGGASLDEETERFWARLAFAVVQGYGMTETTSLISVNHPFKISHRSIGKPMPGREVKLAPDGEILVRGENIASSYWQAGAKQKSSDDGWLHTGDLGAFDSDGNLYFKGRKKTVIVSPSGMNIFPEDLEAALKREPGVREAVVVGVPSGADAEPCAVLLLDSNTNANEVIRAANRSLAEHQQVRHWLVWPESDFPRTPTQKPKLAEIQAFAVAGAKRQAGTLTDVLRTIGRSESAVSGAATLDDLNFSSIDRVELLSALEDRYQVDLADDLVTSQTTVAELEQSLATAESAPSSGYPRWAQRWPVTWVRTLVYHALTLPAMWIMARPKVIGAENLQTVSGPLLVVCNHVTYIDIGFILCGLPWRVRTRLAVAMQGQLLLEMRQPPREWAWPVRLAYRIAWCLIVALFNVFPLPQYSGFRESFAFAGESADRGYSVMIFPEGRRTTDGKMSRFQNGAGILAQRLNVPVVPMRIDGLYEAARANQRLVAPGKIEVHIGAPVRYAPSETPESIAADLERRVREL